VTRILVVDDEIQVVRSVERILERSGYEVRVALSGREALGSLDGVDLVLTDVRMPGMDGIKLVAEVKRRQPGTKCCLMTGESGVDTEALSSPGVDGHIFKPFLIEELLTLLRGCLGAQSERESSAKR
jgi:DNA-binding NtrC family response regulator